LIDLVTANKSPIPIEGAALTRLEGKVQKGMRHSCAAMVYISSQARGFDLSMENMIDLGIISSGFPSIGMNKHSSRYNSASRFLNAGCSPSSTMKEARCFCPVSTVVPDFLTNIPFKCTPEDTPKMEKWLLEFSIHAHIVPLII